MVSTVASDENTGAVAAEPMGDHGTQAGLNIFYCATASNKNCDLESPRVEIIKCIQK